MISIKKLIEKKQARLNGLVLAGRMDKQTANEQILQFAKLLCMKLGDGYYVGLLV